MKEKLNEILKISSPETKNLLFDLIEEKNVNKEILYGVLSVVDSLKLDESCIISTTLTFIFPEVNEKDSAFIKAKFGDDIFEIYSSLKQIDKYSSSNLAEAENFRMMLIAISKDIRVIIIKLCLILYNLRHFELPITPEKRAYLIEVKEIFAPIAERLGINFMKSELEDLCLKYLEPDVYEFLLSSVMLKKDENQQQIDIIKAKIETILKELKIDGTITYRQKHFSSIHKKMSTKNIPLAKIYDLIAMRVIVNTVEECYAVMGGIHSIYKPMPDRFKDYIANPKPNGYQSLHTTIIADNNRPVEIQIRTVEMHKISEYGIAAHWIYKEKREKKSTLDEKLSFIRSIMENSESLTSKELIETFKTQLTAGVIYVQTPKGKIIEFPEGSTLIDFAYAIHSDIGNTCIGGKVNGKIKPLKAKLNNGDVVEIITSLNSKGPSRDWLNHVATASAKSKIKHFFKKEYKEENIKNGRRIIEEEFKTKGLDSSKYLSGKVFENVYIKLCFNEPNELFAAVGYGSLSVRQVVNRLIAEVQKIEAFEKSNQIFNPKITVKKNKDGILIDGDSGMLIRFAGCCSPILGDEIIGYISRGLGVTIHRTNCHNVKFLEQERLIQAEWNEKRGQNFVTSIKVVSQNSNEYLQQVIRQIMELKTYILSVQSKVNNHNHLVSVIKLQVESNEQLDKVIKVISGLKGIFEVQRVND